MFFGLSQSVISRHGVQMRESQNSLYRSSISCCFFGPERTYIRICLRDKRQSQTIISYDFLKNQQNIHYKSYVNEEVQIV